MCIDAFIYVYAYVRYIYDMYMYNFGHFRFSLISLKQNGLTAGAASMDCISPLPSEVSPAVPSAFCSWI